MGLCILGPGGEVRQAPRSEWDETWKLQEEWKGCKESQVTAIETETRVACYIQCLSETLQKLFLSVYVEGGWMEVYLSTCVCVVHVKARGHS